MRSRLLVGAVWEAVHPFQLPHFGRPPNCRQSCEVRIFGQLAVEVCVELMDDISSFLIAFCRTLKAAREN